MKPVANHQTRIRNFGSFDWKWAGTVVDPEAVIIDRAWRTENIVRVTLPGMTRPVWLHRAAVQPFTLWLTSLAELGLRSNLDVCAGAWVPRFVRQNGNLAARIAASRVLGEAHASARLSNHSWGTAIDFDAESYPLGKPCKPGDPRWEVAERAAVYGIAWGQHFTRPDPMHFELVEPWAEAR